MPDLDRSREYGELWNAVGHAGYVQDGREYRLDGKPNEPDVPAKAPAAATRPARPQPTAAAKATGTVAAGAVIPDEHTDAELKTLVEIAGGSWAGRASAIAFLAEQE